MKKNYILRFPVLLAFCLHLVSLPLFSQALSCPPGTDPGFPYTSDFDSGQGQWSGDIGSSQGDWVINTGGTPNFLSGPSGAHQGSYYIYYNSQGAGSPGTSSIISPLVDLSNAIDSAKLSFFYHAYGSGFSGSTLDVSLGVSPTGPFVPFYSKTFNHQEQSSSSDPYTEETVDLSNFTGAQFYLRFTFTTTSSSNTDLALDHIRVSACASCPDPLNFELLATTSSNAILYWDAPAPGYTYELEYGVSGFTPGTGKVETTTPPHTIFGLDPLTPYDFYLRTNCGSGDYSFRQGPVTGATKFSCPTNAFCFTNAGATGAVGPTQAQVTGAYSNTMLDGQVTSSNGIQQWSVPYSAPFKVTVVGAEGGYSFGNAAPAGLGAMMQGEFFLNQGEQLSIVVGQQGSGITNAGGSGGGGSYVVLPGDTPLIVAGGGSGAPNNTNFGGLDGLITHRGPEGGIGSFANGGGGGFLTDGDGGAGNNAHQGKAFVNGSQGGIGTAAQGGFGGGGGKQSTNAEAGGGGGYSGGDRSYVATIYGGGGSVNYGQKQMNVEGLREGHGVVIIQPSIELSHAHNDAGVLNLLEPSVFCPGANDVIVGVQNYGNNVIHSLDVEWTVNGVAQAPVSWTGTLDTLGGTGQALVQVNLGSYTFTDGVYHIEAWTINPNGQTDTVNHNDTLYTSIQSNLPPPTALMITDSTGSTGSFSWQGGSSNHSWIYVVVPRGTSPYAGTPVEVFQEQATATGLSPLSPFDVYVAELCPGGTDTSLWAGPASFETLFSCPQGVYCFTNAGATGSSGPTQSQLDAEYLGDPLVVSVNGYQKWQVPQSGEYKIMLFGAEGGGESGSHRGQGGRTEGTVTLSGGQFLYIAVGQEGQYGYGSSSPPPGGFNGGANGGSATAGGCPTAHGSSGGGASDVRIGDTLLTSRLIVGAGGGGGAGDGSLSYRCGGGGGGGGGYYGGGGGHGGNQFPSNAGAGGTQSAGGTGGGTISGNTNGSLGLGGDGGSSDYFSTFSSQANQYGGDGGGLTGQDGNLEGITSRASAGGGGSSYMGGLPGHTLNNTSTQPGFHTGHGLVLIEPLFTISRGENDAGVVMINEPKIFCPGTNDVVVTISNMGSNQITQVDVQWTVNGIPQPTVPFSGLLDTAGGTGNNTAMITLGSYTFTNAAYDITAWTENPNGKTDTINNNDTAYATVQSYLPPPTHLTIEDSTATSATFSWQGGPPQHSWTYVIVPDGNAPETGVPMSSSVKKVTATGLSPLSVYDVYVAEVCPGGTDTSSWAGPASFETFYKCSQGSYCFINAGASGATGPTQAQVNSAYTGTLLDGQVVSDNGIQRWAVPASGPYKIIAMGAEGGYQSGNNAPAGLGARMEGEFILSQSDTIQVLVGQKGIGVSGGGGTGGGGTFVALANDTPLIVAAGGSGAPNSLNYGQLDGQVTNRGPHGGQGHMNSSLGGGGGGGYLTDGNSADPSMDGKAFVNGGQGGTGASGDGGFGGGGGKGGSFNDGAGGGGYSGGDHTYNAVQYGGGGSYNAGTNQSNQAGFREGYGLVIITPLAPPSIAENDAGVKSLQHPVHFCPGSHDVTVTIKNYGSNVINNVQVGWSVNGVDQTPATFSGILDTSGGSGSSEALVNLGSYTFTDGIYELITWTYDPNGVNDTVNDNDTLYATLEADLPGPNVVLYPLAPLCENDPPVTITGFPGGGTYSGPGVSGNIFDPTVSGVGTFTLHYTYTDPGGCFGSDSADVIVGPVPTVTASASPNPVQYQTATTLSATASGATSFSYSWDPADSLSNPADHTLPNPVTKNLTETTTFTVTATDNNTGCSSTDYVTVNVLGIELNANASADRDTICPGESTTLHANASGGSGSYTYQWSSDPSGFSSNQASPAISPQQSTTYTVTVYDGSDSISTSVSVHVQPPVSVSISGLPASLCETDSTATLTGIPAGGVFTGNGMAGNSFDPAIAGTGTHTITYTYTDAYGCTSSTNQNIEVLAAPVVYFSGLSGPYCEDAPPVTLIGTPSGGTFSGDGVSGNTFDPSMAGPGNHAVNYSFTNAQGCSNSSTLHVTVNSIPSVSFSGLDPQYCMDTALVILSGNPSGGIFSGNGITGNSFSTQTAGPGTHTIRYDYTDPNGCSNYSEQPVTVHPETTVSFSGLASNYCADEPGQTLSGSPSGGSFSGPGISGSTFIPGNAPHDTPVAITYSYTDANNCTYSETHTTTVHSLPVVSIGSVSTNYCIGDTPVILTGSPSGGTFNGAGITGNTFDPNIAGTGSHTITYSYSDAMGCSGADTITFEVHTGTPLSISGLNSDYCVDDPQATVSVSPTGGVLSGPGITANTFDPALAGAGAHIINYTYVNTYGCTSSTDQPVNVHSLPVVSFSGLAATYCENDAAVTLSGSPSGGSFSGNGITGNSFSPTVGGSGNHIIDYTFTDINGCTGHDSQSTIVHPLPLVSGGNDTITICQNDPPVNLATLGLATPAGGEYQGPGIVANAIDPSGLNPGYYSTTYSYTTSQGCVAVDSVSSLTIHVIDAPQITLSGLSAGYCTNGAPDTLFPVPANGTFSIAGSGSAAFTGHTFYPSLAPTGLIDIVYSVPGVCPAKDTFQTMVHPLPMVDAGADTSIPFGTHAVLEGSTSGISGNALFLWKPGHMVTDSSQATTTTINLNTNQTFTLEVTDDATLCAASDHKEVFITGGPLSINPEAYPDSICPGTAVTLKANPSGGTGSYTFLWTTPANNTFNTNEISSKDGSGYYVIEVDDGVNTLKDSVFITEFPAPHADITGLPYTFCHNDTATVFSGVPAGGNMLGSGISAVPGTDNFRFDPQAVPSGFHEIKYIYTNTYGCSDSAFQLVEVLSPPVVQVSGFNTQFCPDEPPVTLSATPSGGWFSGTGVSGDTFNPNQAGTGMHILTYHYDYHSGCVVTKDFTMEVFPLPPADAGPEITLPCGSPGQTIGTPATPGMSYLWKPAAGLNDTTMAQPLASPYVTTLYTLMVTNNNTGCVNQSQTRVNVTGGPTASIWPNDTTICQNQPLTLHATGGDSYQWSTGDTGTTITVFPQKDTSYIVTVFSGFCGSLDTAHVTIMHADLNLSPVYGFCKGDSITIDPGSFAQYLWNDSVTSPVWTTSTPGTYWLEVADSIGCTATDTFTVFERDLPAVDLGPDTSINQKEVAQLDAGSGFEAYLWNTGSTAQAIQVPGADYGPGDHLFWVYVTDPHLCTNTDSVLVTVIDASAIEEKLGEGQVTLHPNPNKGEFRLTGENIHEVLSISIHSSGGTLILNKELEPKDGKITQAFNLPQLTQGVYFLRMQTASHVKTIRFVVTR